MSRPRNPHIGPTVESWLEDEGLHASATAIAVKRVLAWQIAEAMQAAQLSKAEMARRMETSRPQLDRLLDPANPSVTLDTLAKAAQALGRRLRIEIV